MFPPSTVFGTVEAWYAPSYLVGTFGASIVVQNGDSGVVTLHSWSRWGMSLEAKTDLIPFALIFFERIGA